MTWSKLGNPTMHEQMSIDGNLRCYQWYCPPLIGALTWVSIIFRRQTGSSTDMEAYSAMDNTLLRANKAVKMNDQNRPPVPPFVSPGPSDLCSVSRAHPECGNGCWNVRQRHLPTRLYRCAGREHCSYFVYSLCSISNDSSSHVK